jgi:predicted transposase YdaD
MLPAVIARMKRRLGRQVTPRRAAELWSAAYILMGLRYEQALVQRLLQGVMAMKESVTYQAIIQEGMAEGLTRGRIEEARKILLLQGRSRLGEPSPEALAAVNALTDVRKLEELTLRLLQAASWQELLGPDGAGRRGRKPKKTP